MEDDDDSYDDGVVACGSPVSSDVTAAMSCGSDS